MMSSIKQFIDLFIRSTQWCRIWIEDKTTLERVKVWEGLAWKIPEEYLHDDEWSVIALERESDITNIVFKGVIKNERKID